MFPGGEASIEQSRILVPEPPQQPPGPSGDASAGIVIDNDGRIVTDTECANAATRICSIRQWVPAGIRPGRARKVPLEVRVNGARNVALVVLTPTGCRIQQ